MPYNAKDFKQTNVNYLNKDFDSFKQSLMEYAKTYFPNSYKDFNETSPGMMLMEMSAYVGDVLSFYVDQQYREMLLPLAEEKRNIINIAKMLGYKVKPVTASYVNLEIKQIVDADSTKVERPPNTGQLNTIDKGLKVTSTDTTDVIFETLAVADFRASGSINGETVKEVASNFDADGLVTEWTFTRTVKAISGQTKTKSFTVGAPTKFLELTINDIDVTEIISIKDSNGNSWYEVDFLAQDMIPIEKHWTEAGRSSDIDAPDGYTTDVYGPDGQTIIAGQMSVPYSLSFAMTAKRFITKTNDDNTTSLVFGNGILRSGQTLNSDQLFTSQVGINIPGTSFRLTNPVDPITGDEYSTLGEAPAHTTLTVTYRAGGGLTYNVQSSDLTNFSSVPYLGTVGEQSNSRITVNNSSPARGGSSQQSVDEIRERAMGFFAAQNRCVTKEDYEARALSLPARFGSIAKVYVRRSGGFSEGSLVPQVVISNLELLIDALYSNAGSTDQFNTIVTPELLDINETGGDDYTQDKADAVQIITNGGLTQEPGLSVIELHTLSYDSNKNLVRLQNSDETTMHLVHANLKNYITNFRIISDEVAITSGYIINFGVYFNIVAHIHANKQEIKLKCIQAIRDYFNISKMQFKQSIYVSQLEYELMGIDGVRAVNYVTITQDYDYNNPENISKLFGIKSLYYYSFQGDSSWAPDTTEGQLGYGYRYDFGASFDKGIIRPSAAPAVFELKNPNQNIKGVVL